MKKLESSLKNMLMVLTAVTVVAVALLAIVNQITEAPIREANKKALEEGLKIALNVNPADALAVQAEETLENGSIIYKTDKGTAVQATTQGFGGDLKVLVGFDAEGTILNYSILATAETPGLGSKAADWFKAGGKGNITGKNPGEKELKVTKDQGEIDAITASTITSRAFLAAVNKAYESLSASSDGGAGATEQVKKENVEQTAQTAE
ncbi:MAG: RnfABCDGE type electron transport complex subunit G [Bacteroidales bacterium]|nr:RnfABCDGE type electron transport complex subunit G [Bacteroidales bacterium]